MRIVTLVLAGIVGVAAGCSTESTTPTWAAAVVPPTATTAAAGPATVPALQPTAAPPSTTLTPVTVTTGAPFTTTTVSPFARPPWLGTRVLPLGPDGENALPQSTPAELSDRRLTTLDVLPPPADASFAFTIGPVPDHVLARSTWTEECPVGRDDLAYVTLTHVGFDGAFHTGELIVNHWVASDVVGVFAALHAARFPIEQMRVITQEDLDAAPTGDGNETTGFVCRPAVGSTSWSQHSYGLAVDINPFHNPYAKGELVLPELATDYVDRDRVLPGMVFDGGTVVEAFAAIGWSWGGDWRSLKDWMHFSESGH
jgi:hypothetical protein